LNNQQSTSVTQIIVRRFNERARSVKDSLRLSRSSKPRLEMDWDEAEHGVDVDLVDDQNMLRDLEAEIYALTDQFNTEQGLNEVSSA